MKDNKYNQNSHSGKFNKRISIWGPSVTTDEIGNQIETFGEIIKLWSMVKTTKGSEYSAAGQNNYLNVTRFVVRYSRYLEALFIEKKAKLEVVYKGSNYDIKSIINDDESNITFTIIAESKG